MLSISTLNVGGNTCIDGFAFALEQIEKPGWFFDRCGLNLGSHGGKSYVWVPAVATVWRVAEGAFTACVQI
ncbi:hypothetical protein, partial [Cupriavidus sp. HMR-1]